MIQTKLICDACGQEITHGQAFTTIKNGQVKIDGREAPLALIESQERHYHTQCVQVKPITPTKGLPVVCGDCLDCWCRECAAFETCTKHFKAWDEVANACPCDGCGKGMKFRPKSEPPCEEYQKREDTEDE